MGQIYLLCHFIWLPLSAQHPTDSLSFQLIPGIHHTYGYDIIRNGRVLIHQPSIPCLPGMDGFASAKDARRVARLAIGKIRKGVMPPSVTLEEMRSAGAHLPVTKSN